MQPTGANLNVLIRFMEYTQAFGSGTVLQTTQLNNLPANAWTQATVTTTALRSGERIIPQIYSTNEKTSTGNLLYDDCSVTGGSGPPPPSSAADGAGCAVGCGCGAGGWQCAVVVVGSVVGWWRGGDGLSGAGPGVGLVHVVDVRGWGVVDDRSHGDRSGQWHGV